MNRCSRTRQKGYVLLAALLALMAMSGLAIGLMYLVNTETRIGYSDEAGTLAYYGAEAVMEKLTADLGALYTQKQSPTADDIKKLGTDSNIDLGGGSLHATTSVDFEDSNGNTTSAPTVSSGTVGGTGEYAGLLAQTIKMRLTSTVTLNTTGEQVQIIREVEVALIPVFQFGAFSDEDLAYHAGEKFDFDGRVHTNGNLFLDSESGDGLYLRAQVSAVKDVVRAKMQNGLNAKTNPVWIATGFQGCDKDKMNACRELKINEGSVTAGPGSGANNTMSVNGQITSWQVWAGSNYPNNYLVSPAKALNLPFVAPGVAPIELLRRPLANEDPAGTLSSSRMYNMANIRVLIDDNGDTPLTGKSPSGITATVPNTKLTVTVRDKNGNWNDVTGAWKALGINQVGATGTDTAILKFTTSNGKAPINLYDGREGGTRDAAQWVCTCAGTMNTVELDVANLRKWLIANSGSVDSDTPNGYILYFSDQRGMLENTDVPSSHPDYKRKAGYGFTNVANPQESAGVPNKTLDDGEYLNRLPGYTVDDPLGFGAVNNAFWNTPLTYGAANVGNAFNKDTSDLNPYKQVTCSVASTTWVTGARHALKLVNGSAGNLPSTSTGGGFTIAAENPAYIQGNYNANYNAKGEFSDFDGHVPAAILADTVTLLSNSWSDKQSFYNPGDAKTRIPTETFYRMAVATGKSLPFPHPSWGNSNVGLEGGVHNLLRYLEGWGSSGKVTSHYKGSLVSLFLVQYNTGIYKDGGYTPPKRDYSFDEDFKVLSKLPPGTPHFRDIVSLSFSQSHSPR